MILSCFGLIYDIFFESIYEVIEGNVVGGLEV